MRYTWLWCALAASYSARQGAGLAPVCPVDTYQHHISISEVPTPLGILSPLSGMDRVISVSIDISRYLGRALVVR